MELLGHNFLFRNASSDEVNVLYKEGRKLWINWNPDTLKL